MNPYQSPTSDPSDRVRPQQVEKSHQWLIKFCIFSMFALALLISFFVTILPFFFRVF
ncbi:MAG: hypothetical protein AAGG48_29835 [Planctomycetota bacterium]